MACMKSFEGCVGASFEMLDYFCSHRILEAAKECSSELDCQKIEVVWSRCLQDLERKIDEYKEYRDILYGNTDGHKSELKRYSILESKDYQTIPKTIQNVFLNSKMEAEFIKQTIIMSLENDVRIDLNQYAHHLNGFETQLSDIRKIKTPGARCFLLL